MTPARRRSADHRRTDELRRRHRRPGEEYDDGNDRDADAWEVLCDGKLVAQINTMNKVCNGSVMTNGCSVAFPQLIELRPVEDGMFGAGSCCADAAPDSSIGSVSAW